MKLPPGPHSTWKKIKMLLSRRKDPIQFYHDTFQTYGDLVYLKFGKLRFLMLNDPDAIEEVLQTDAKNYVKSVSYERFRLVFGNGLLISTGEIWRKQRLLMASAFTTKSIERMHPLIMEETRAMMKSWKDSTKLDLAEEMNLVTLQIISKSMLDQLDEEETKIIRSSVQEILRYLQTSYHHILMMILSIVPVKDKIGSAIKLERFLPLPITRRFFKSIHLIDTLVHTIIEKRRHLNANENLLDQMIKATDGEGQGKMSNQQLRDEVVNILLAGHETTSNALSWTFHQILKYPEIHQKMKEEIQRVVKNDIATYEELNQLTYTQAVFKESMRLFPPFWRVSRMSIKDTKVKGYDIPAGTNVIAGIYTIQRDSRYWKDALEFKPERFMGKDPETHRFAYIPFGAGPRICIGVSLAMTEAITIIASVIKNYELTKDFKDDPTLLLSITMQPKEGCQVKVKKAQA